MHILVSWCKSVRILLFLLVQNGRSDERKSHALQLISSDREEKLCQSLLKSVQKVLYQPRCWNAGQHLLNAEFNVGVVFLIVSHCS